LLGLLREKRGKRGIVTFRMRLRPRGVQAQLILGGTTSAVRRRPASFAATCKLYLIPRI
jgi:hypothetical protein